MTTPLSSMAWVLAAAVVGSGGAVFLKIGAGRIGKSIFSIATNWRLGIGICFYLLSSVFFVLGVREGELSVLYPLVSLNSVCTLFWSRIFLGESLTPAKFLALGLILLGITLLGLGSSHS